MKIAVTESVIVVQYQNHTGQIKDSEKNRWWNPGNENCRYGIRY
nr:MAG TPA: hypothetical protein [Caudoviricetes sp.]